jgi:endonuclease/exonuclease/phosphatase family metal-dependent hydrolase
MNKRIGIFSQVALSVLTLLFCLADGAAFAGVYKNTRSPGTRSHVPEKSALTTAGKDGPKIRVASYNIRYDAKADYDSGNGWNTRKAALARLIIDHRFEIIGTQEGDSSQMSDLMQLLPGFAFVGYPYGGATGKIHTASIVYKKSEFEILDQGEFWYSETPDVESMGWDATDLRICTWARVRHRKSGLEFYFFSSHFYWRYHTAKEHSGKVLVDKIREIVKDDLPVISTGDLNSPPSSPQIADISAYLRDAYAVTEKSPAGLVPTAFHGGVFTGTPNSRIDYIFVNKKVRVLSYATLNDTYDQGRHPSDHLPITAEIRFAQ